MKTPEQIESELRQILVKIAFEQISYTEAHDNIIELFNSNRLTDEQIDAMFPETGDASVDYYLPLQIQAAREVRDLLQGKGGEGV